MTLPLTDSELELAFICELVGRAALSIRSKRDAANETSMIQWLTVELKKETDPTKQYFIQIAIELLSEY
jgi:hypothetical protein